MAQILGFWSLVESKWCHYVMVEADSQLKLLPRCTLDIQCDWAHWYAVYGHMAVASNSYTHTIWNFVVLGHLCSQNDVITSWLRHTANSNCSPHLHRTYEECLSTLICCPWAYISSFKQLYPHYLAHILGFWVTFGVKMMSLRHGWPWQPPQTACCIHIRHIQSVWPHWYAVHGQMAVASNSYTHTTWIRFLGLWSLVESTWCHCVMVETDSQLKLLPTYTLNIYKVFEHIDILSMGIQQ